MADLDFQRVSPVIAELTDDLSRDELVALIDWLWKNNFRLTLGTLKAVRETIHKQQPKQANSI